MTTYAVATDHDYTETHKRERLSIWQGAFASEMVGEAFTLPNRDGYMVRLTDYSGDRVRVTCPTPRTDDNYAEVDAAISDALAEHYRQREAVALHLPTD